ncbi:hypothetical protein SAY86_013245 [Trapa natans]|uniref:DUF4378 domain-containing protein n=1 Tax=Trapa natans TaxID=22666 RepID=A0AAN7LY06_TRANT|nr:hypothetical protein SAY86_013245 [Trapa natans]
MGLDKEGSKGGGYVGGFFHLFDWKAKSRKKLFSSKSDLPEHSKQGKKNDGNFPTTRVYLMDEDDNGIWSSGRGNTDHSCASSVTDEEGCGSRGPNVVARLMGLDSMPTTYSSESYSTPFFDTQSLREAEFNRTRNVEYSQNYHQMYSGDLIMKTEDLFRNHVELKPNKIVNRPIEKFQTEMLPRKSAKTIPITQHKLLSPIKCPGFVPSMNAAHIMEAAAKIIESAPQATAVRGKVTLHVPSSSAIQLRVRDFKKEREYTMQRAQSGSSSVPLRVKDLKEKVEGTLKTASRLPEASLKQVGSDCAAMRYLEGQALNKSFNGGAGASTSSRASAESQEGFSASKNNGKSISLAIQAKVNVQKREGLASGERSRLMANHQKEQNENKLAQSFRTHHRVQKNMHKESSNFTVSGALRQNNQKQNCQIDKEKLTRKASASNGRKVLLKPVSKLAATTKTGSRKLEALDMDKETSQSNIKNFPRKKRSIEGVQFEKNKVTADDSSLDQNRNQAQTSSVVQKQFCWSEGSRKKGTDVVSFTFTAPLTRSMMGSESPNLNQSSENLCKRVFSESDNLKLSSLDYNVLGGDALSKLLEQKLRELTNDVGSSSSYNASASLDSILSSTSVFQDSGPTPDTITSKSRQQDNREQNIQLDSHVSNPPLARFKHEFQGHDDMEVEHVAEAKQPLDYRYPSPISVLEPSFVTGSRFSSDSMDCDWMEGNKHSISQVSEILGPSPLRRSYSLDADMDMSDSASSVSIGGTITEKNTSTGTSSEFPKSTEWEVEYIKEVLSDIELMFKDLSFGRSQSIIHPRVFEQLEVRVGSTRTDDIDSWLRRKALFDCVSECMEVRFQNFVGGGFQAWEKGFSIVKRKEKLAEDVYKEILSLRGLANSMVDDLVDRDMSTQNGKWLHFEPNTFELGIEIGGNILDSLIDEAISGILRCNVKAFAGLRSS